MPYQGAKPLGQYREWAPDTSRVMRSERIVSHFLQRNSRLGSLLRIWKSTKIRAIPANLITPDMFRRTDDLRIQWTKVVLPPVFLEEELPLTERASSTVYQARAEVQKILHGKDHRLLVIVGPCSIHDPIAAREYANKLKDAIGELKKDLHIVMRVYFEKPRTTIGWKGLINDPHLDESFKINDGLREARHLLLDVADMGVPAGTEFLDM